MVNEAMVIGVRDSIINIESHPPLDTYFLLQNLFLLFFENKRIFYYFLKTFEFAF